MPNTLQITNELTLTPMIDMRNMAFAKHYRDGLCWSLSGDYKGDKPLSDTHLVQTGQLRPDVTTLVACSHPDASKGYYVGRRDCFMDTPSHQCIYIDSELVEELCQIAQDVMVYLDEENSW